MQAEHNYFLCNNGIIITLRVQQLVRASNWLYANQASHTTFTAWNLIRLVWVLKSKHRSN